MKKIFATLLVAIFVIAVAVMPASAALVEPPVAQPLWNSIGSIISDVIFDGNTGYASGYATKQTDADAIEGTLTVYKIVNNEWVFVDSTYRRAEQGSISMEIEFQGESGIVFISEFKVTAYTDGVGETHTKYVTERCP